MSVRGAMIYGIEGREVLVDVSMRRGEGIEFSGLPAREGKECGVRVLSAIRSLGYGLSSREALVTVSPAQQRSTSMDLAVAVALLSAIDAVPKVATGGKLFVGELTLSGTLLPVRGALPMVLDARAKGVCEFVLPTANAVAVSTWVKNGDVRGMNTLLGVVEYLRGRSDEYAPPMSRPERRPRAVEDLIDVRGMAYARRALEIAAAGGHHLLIVGPPGSGKTLLASRMPGILPPLSAEEALQTAVIYSASGLPVDQYVFDGRPFRAPHHTVSYAGLLGGDNPPRPGEITLAHNGVLFLDEFPEFGAGVLDALRSAVTAGKTCSTAEFPADVQIVAAANPCPCGFYGVAHRRCVCKPNVIARYRSRWEKVFGGIFDIRVSISALDAEAEDVRESSFMVRDRVAAARYRQIQRWQQHGARGSALNARLDNHETNSFASPDSPVGCLIAEAVEHLGKKPEDMLRILRVARTVADLEGSESVEVRHAEEAIRYA